MVLAIVYATSGLQAAPLALGLFIGQYLQQKIEEAVTVPGIRSLRWR